MEDARARLEGLVWRTPVLASHALARLVGVPVGLKAENLQHTGSFKLRGATNAIAKLPPDRIARGIVTASAGNHAQAVARAAASADAKATVCMPAGCPLAKLEAVEELGAEVRLIEDTYEDSQQAARDLAEREDRPLIHPFADPDVIAGQGSVGLEIADDAPETRLIVVPMGGGGLVSGVAIAAKHRLGDVRVVAVQAAERSGRTIADGIAVKRPADLSRQLVDEYVDEVVAVSDDEIAQAMVHLIERSKLVVEGAGAAGVAAVLCARVEPPAGGSACIVLSGGNVDASLLAECIRMGETAAGRRAVLKTVVPDRPGALDAVLRVVAARGANIVDVAHLREGIDLHVRETLIRLVLQTRGREHGLKVTEALRAEGFDVDIEH